MKKYFILPLFFIVWTSVGNSEESVLLKSTRTKTIVPMSGYLVPINEEKDHMPGNDNFGFFYKEIGNGKGLCRIRSKVYCDYGFEILKEIKLKTVTLTTSKGIFESKTDDSGLLDLIFRCEAKIKSDEVNICIGKYVQNFEIQLAPKEFKLLEKYCK